MVLNRSFLGLWVLALFATTTVAHGCRLEDSGCRSDDECRSGRTCVEGLCVGAVGLGDDGVNNGGTNDGSTNNASTNNGADNNGDSNNGTPNNGVANNGVANNGVANNGGPVECVGDDCPDGLVCAYDDELVRLECREPWVCDVMRDGDAMGCFFAFFCDDGPYLLECKFDPAIGSSLCFCVGPNGEEAEFDLPSNACENPEAAVAAANTGCGFRLPLPLPG